MKAEDLEKQCSKLSYGKVAELLRSIPTDVLLSLLDSRSIKVGDTATDFLGHRNQHETVIRMVLEGQIRTKNGKMRATSLMHGRGRKLPQAIPAYLSLLEDRNPDVVERALFGLVFFQDKTHLPAIRRLVERTEPSTRLHDEAKKAVEALEKGNPYVFEPNFRDGTGVWKM